MGAPVAVATALANTRTGRRVVIGVALTIGLAFAALLTPLFAIPFMAVGGATTATVQDARAAQPAVSGLWGYPLAGGFFKGRGFGYNPVAGCSYCSTNHQGYDMSQGCGSAIFAAGPGRVITAGAYQGYGNAVRIDHGNAVVTLYGHMHWGSLRVNVGDIVAAGTPLGAEGNTGRSFGCHLHFEVRERGIPVDPQPFMAAFGLPLK